MNISKKHISSLIEKYPCLSKIEGHIVKATNAIIHAFKTNKKLLLVGNGGSASDCDHIAGELLKSFDLDRNINDLDLKKFDEELASNIQGSLPVIPLPNFTGFISAFNNDCNPNYCYAQLVYGLAQKGDVLLAISTSGNSINIINALKIARFKNCKTVLLTGNNGGNAKDFADCNIIMPQKRTDKIQELHLPVYHTICLELEEYFFSECI